MDIVSSWNDLVAQGGPSADRFLDDVVRAGVACGAEPRCGHRRPHFVPVGLVGTLRGSLKLLHRTLRAVIQVLRAEGLDGRPGSMAAQLGIPGSLLELAAVDPGYEADPLIAGVPCLVHGGHPMFIGLDTDVPLGLASFDALSRLFWDDPIMAGFPGLVAYRGADEIVQAAQEAWTQWGGAQRLPSVVLATAPGADPCGLELLRRVFGARDMRCEIAPADALTATPYRLSLRGEPVDLVVRAFSFRSYLAHPEDYTAVVRAYQTRKVCLINSFQSALLGTNALFAYLHDLGFLRGLPEAQRDMVRHHIPWTGLLSHAGDTPHVDQLRALAIAHRSELVLKPVRPQLGRVVGGWTVSQDDWEALIEDAGDHVIQRRVPQEVAAFPNARRGYALEERRVRLAAFLVRGRLSGLGCTLTVPEHADDLVPVFAVP